MAVMRPSWPPPRIPIVAPGRIGATSNVVLLAGLGGALRAPRPETLANLGVSRADDRGGEEGGVRRPGLPDRERAHGDALGHLHDRQESVHAVEQPSPEGTPSTGRTVRAATMPGR